MGPSMVSSEASVSEGRTTSTAMGRAIEEPEVLRAIDSLQSWFAQQPAVGKTLSFVDFIERMNAAMNGDDLQKGLSQLG